MAQRGKRSCDRIFFFWKNEIQKEAAQKSSLSHLSHKTFQAGKPHFIWESATIDTLQVKKAGVRANLVTGTYKLQMMVSKFQGGNVSSRCRICNMAEENMQHFILECPFHLFLQSSSLLKMFPFLSLITDGVLFLSLLSVLVLYTNSNLVVQ